MKVIETLQGLLPDEDGNLPDPVEMSYYTGDDMVELLGAVTSAVVGVSKPDRFFRVVSMRIEF